MEDRCLKKEEGNSLSFQEQMMLRVFCSEGAEGSAEVMFERLMDEPDPRRRKALSGLYRKLAAMKDNECREVYDRTLRETEEIIRVLQFINDCESGYRMRKLQRQYLRLENAVGRWP